MAAETVRVRLPLPESVAHIHPNTRIVVLQVEAVEFFDDPSQFDAFCVQLRFVRELVLVRLYAEDGRIPFRTAVEFAAWARYQRFVRFVGFDFDTWKWDDSVLELASKLWGGAYLEFRDCFRNEKPEKIFFDAFCAKFNTKTDENRAGKWAFPTEHPPVVVDARNAELMADPLGRGSTESVIVQNVGAPNFVLAYVLTEKFPNLGKLELVVTDDGKFLENAVRCRKFLQQIRSAREIEVRAHHKNQKLEWVKIVEIVSFLHLPNAVRFRDFNVAGATGAVNIAPNLQHAPSLFLGDVVSKSWSDALAELRRTSSFLNLVALPPIPPLPATAAVAPASAPAAAPPPLVPQEMPPLPPNAEEVMASGLLDPNESESESEAAAEAEVELAPESESIVTMEEEVERAIERAIASNATVKKVPAKCIVRDPIEYEIVRVNNLETIDPRRYQVYVPGTFENVETFIGAFNELKTFERGALDLSDMGWAPAAARAAKRFSAEGIRPIKLIVKYDTVRLFPAKSYTFEGTVLEVAYSQFELYMIQNTLAWMKTNARNVKTLIVRCAKLSFVAHSDRTAEIRMGQVTELVFKNPKPPSGDSVFAPGFLTSCLKVFRGIRLLRIIGFHPRIRDDSKWPTLTSNTTRLDFGFQSLRARASEDEMRPEDRVLRDFADEWNMRSRVDDEDEEEMESMRGRLAVLGM